MVPPTSTTTETEPSTSTRPVLNLETEPLNLKKPSGKLSMKKRAKLPMAKTIKKIGERESTPQPSTKIRRIQPTPVDDDDDDEVPRGKRFKSPPTRVTRGELSAARELLDHFRLFRAGDPPTGHSLYLCQSLDALLKLKLPDESEEAYLSAKALELIRQDGPLTPDTLILENEDETEGEEEEEEEIDEVDDGDSFTLESEEDEDGRRRKKKKIRPKAPCKEKSRVSLSIIRTNPETIKKKKKKEMKRPESRRVVAPMAGGDGLIVFGEEKIWGGNMKSRHVVLQRRYLSKEGENKTYDFSFSVGSTREIISAIRIIAKELEEICCG